jgi:hypothetical protein
MNEQNLNEWALRHTIYDLISEGEIEVSDKKMVLESIKRNDNPFGLLSEDKKIKTQDQIENINSAIRTGAITAGTAAGIMWLYPSLRDNMKKTYNSISKFSSTTYDDMKTKVLTLKGRSRVRMLKQLKDANKSFKNVQVLQNQYDKLERMDAPTNVLKPMRVRMDELHFKAMKFAGLNNHADPKNLKNSDFVNYRGLKGMMTRKQAENYGTSLKFKDSLKNAEAMKTHWWVMGDAKDKKNWIKASKEAIRSRDKLSTRLPSIQNDPKISGTGIAKFGKPIHRLLGKITWQTSGKTALITAGIAGAVYAGYKAYDRYYSQAGKSCKGLKGSQRSKCVYMYKDKASNEAITKLKEALSGCQEKSDPDKCKMSIMRQLTKWRTRQKKYQQKLKKYNQ